ncbi:phospholipase A1-Ibeta2, chloroplastic-like [Lycium ferocissimum]|uniref:phospholipase A1-Ibeta2, chloroplastic-like n=1 Tax=Lycium ferocissimum TaxID=112874 RepID=UPI002815C0E1|nr:phospholipase A1-Ibeta2, chloroplastic-like [Lycium ferocissimum]
MMIGATLPATNLHFYQARKSSFRCNGSPLNPSRKGNPVNTQNMTKKHLSNLEKLLQNQSMKPQLLDLNKVHQESSNGSNENNINNISSVTPQVGSKEGKMCTDVNPTFVGKKLLEGLNLSRYWPEHKVAEEMSPRHLNRLKKMLSSSNIEYSPRNSLGSRWKEYHGSNDWLGLIDPLNENLRRELVRYGEFIQAAYHCFHSNPATCEDEGTWGPRNVALPDKSYKVTKSLYATSSIGLPKWVDDVAPDLGWMTQRSSWIGYVAVCDDRSEIQRMGRRDIVIALRGTATCLEWGENFRDLLVQIPTETETESAKVEYGFLSLFQTAGVNVPSLAESVVNEVQRLIEQYKGESLSITVTGHSLGAALALLVADEVSTCAPDAPPVAVFSFGGPRVGNRSFAERLNSKNVKVLRIVNNQDLITRVPGMFVSEELDKKLRESGLVSGVLNALDKSMPWAYAHVGTELRVDTRMSPFLKPDADVACCHDLEAYLHLVDGYLASNCPFRANAKRSLARLLNEQKPNIKRLYTSKGKGLNHNLEREHSFSAPS